VDESGNQIAVFGRVGARPLNLLEQRKLYYRDGRVWRVSDDPYDPDYIEVRAGGVIETVPPSKPVLLGPKLRIP
jgi:hypothetical protein